MNLWPWSSAARVERERAEALEAAMQKQEITFNQLLERFALQNQTVAGLAVNPTNALRCSAVLGVVRALTNAISSYPVAMQRWTVNGTRVQREPLPNHTLNRLLRRPNGVQTSAEFFSMAITHVLLWGDFYALKGAGQSGPVRFLRPVENPDAVSLESVNWAEGATFKVSLDNGEQRDMAQRQLLHFTNGIVSGDGITGVSPVAEHKEAIAICIAAEQLLSKLYGNNDVPPYAITADSGFASKETYDGWMKTFKESRAETNKNGTGALLLPPGMSVKELSFKPIDVLLVEVIKQKSREIFAGYGVPPHKVADLERATFSNIEELDLEFVRDTMEPHVERFSQAMGRDLLTEDDVRAGVRVRFETEQATKGKFEDQVRAYVRGLTAGVYSPNDIRAKLGENSREDGDDYVLAANLTTEDERDNDVSSNTGGPGDGGESTDADAGDEAAPLRAV